MKYIILKSNDIDEMINLVNKYIGNGWKPQGGICESGGDEVPLFLLQAMIKDDKS